MRRYTGLTIADRWNPSFDSSNRLKKPPVAVAGPNVGGETHYKIVMQQAAHDFHPKLKKIPVLTYNGNYPGPTIVARENVPVRVTWKNDITTNLYSVLELGPRQGMEMEHMLIKSHNVVHVHGAHVPADSDGHPEMSFHRPEQVEYRYPNDQAAGTLWYHDHTMDVTRLNVYAGLFGLYLLRSPAEAAALPSGTHEIPLVLQDKSFDEFGKKLAYEQEIQTHIVPGTETYQFDAAVPEFVGDYPLVNGRIWPVTTLKPHIYRLRLCNGANTRIFEIYLADGAQKLDLHVIGTEGGFLPRTVPVKTLRILPGERYDVLIDLTASKGKDLILKNRAATPAGPVTQNCKELLKIKVRGAISNAFSAALVQPPARADLPPFDLTPAEIVDANRQADLLPPAVITQTLVVAPTNRQIQYRRFVLDERGETMMTVDLAPGTGLTTIDRMAVKSPNVKVNGEDWTTAPALDVGLNTFEMWEFINLTADAHPMHVHLVQFKIAGRIKVDVQPATVPPATNQWTGYLGPTMAPERCEAGFKDTARCPSGDATRVIMKFDGYRGEYIYHCHILEHEDMGMMFKLNVV